MFWIFVSVLTFLCIWDVYCNRNKPPALTSGHEK